MINHSNVCSLDFCLSHNIKLHHLGVLYSTNAWDPITEDIVLQALHLLVQPSTYPVLVMCNLGRHRTGTVIGCLRKLQKWCLSAILEEYRRYAGQKVRVMNEQVSPFTFSIAPQSDDKFAVY
jgi:tyrosine-protein phosphatase OCA1